MGRRVQGRHLPPKWAELSEEEKSLFTLKGAVEQKDWFITNGLSEAEDNFYHQTTLNAMIEAIHNRITEHKGSYPTTSAHLYECLKHFPIDRQEVAVMGSVTPWHEAFCLAYGGIPTTVEYNKISTDDSRLNLLTVEEFQKLPKKFDAVFSISSFEHDGLARYGDPLDPEGDLKAMKNVKDNILKPGGLLYLAVPVGKDTLWWNAHRVYGEKRWPLLIEGFEFVYCPDVNFFNALQQSHSGRNYYQPAIVLRSLL